MQSQHSHHAAPKMSAETKKKSKGGQQDGNKGTGIKRIKTSQACDECRKRKVKCDGLQPCEHCRKIEADCNFAKQPPKKGPPKQYIEHLEARLQRVEKAILTIDGPARQILSEAMSVDLCRASGGDAVTPSTEDQDEPPSPTLSTQSIKDVDGSTPSPIHPHGGNQSNDTNNYSSGSMARHSPSKDISRNRDLPRDSGSEDPSRQHPQMMDTDNDPSGNPPTCWLGLPPDAPLPLIDAYFTHIHRYMPMLYKPHFLRQASSNTDPVSPLLVYAMCAVASRWVSEPTTSGYPPGFAFYNRAFMLIEEYADAPRLSTIQAFLLLAKYQESYIRPGQRSRPGMFLTLAVGMCNDLGLHQKDSSSQTEDTRYDAELKKRTFWTTFIYDLMFSMEQGRDPSYTATQCAADLPMPTSEESPELAELVNHYNSLIRLSKLLSDIYVMSRRADATDQRAYMTPLTVYLEAFRHELPNTPAYVANTITTNAYPVEQHAAITDMFTAHLHILYNVAVILLYRLYIDCTQSSHLTGYPLDLYQNRSQCTTSASNITHTAETLLENASTSVFRYPICGMHYAVYCLELAASIHQQEMNLGSHHAASSMARQQWDKTMKILKRLQADIPARDGDAEHHRTHRLATADPAKSSAISLSLYSAPNAANLSTSSLSTDFTASVPINDRLSISDTSSASSSPLQQTMDVSHVRGSKKMRRNGVPVNLGTVHNTKHTHPSSSKQHTGPATFTMDGGGLFSPAAFYHSSGAYADPVRYTSIMMQAETNGSVYNHHQQPIYGSMRGSMRRNQSPYPLHKAHSQDDLQGNFKSQTNTTAHGHWPAQKAGLHPANGGMGHIGFPHRVPTPGITRHTMRRPTSMVSIKSLYNTHRPQQQGLPPQRGSPMADTRRRSTVSSPGAFDDQTLPPSNHGMVHGIYPFGGSTPTLHSDLQHMMDSTGMSTAHSHSTKQMYVQPQQVYPQHLQPPSSQPPHPCDQPMDMDASVPSASDMTFKSQATPNEELAISQYLMTGDPNMGYMFHNGMAAVNMEDLQRSEGHVI